MTTKKLLGLAGLVTASAAFAADVIKEAPTLVGWPIAYPQFGIGPSLYYATRERFGQYSFISGIPDVDTLADPKAIYVICDYHVHPLIDMVIESSNGRYTLDQRKDPENFVRFPDDYPTCYTIEKEHLGDSPMIWFRYAFGAIGNHLTLSQGSLSLFDNAYDSQRTFVFQDENPSCMKAYTTVPSQDDVIRPVSGDMISVGRCFSTYREHAASRGVRELKNYNYR